MQGLPAITSFPKVFEQTNISWRETPTGDWPDFFFWIGTETVGRGRNFFEGASKRIKTFGKGALAPWKDTIERNWYQVDPKNWLIQQFIQFNRPISSNFNLTTSPLGLCAKIWSSTTLSGGSWELLPDFSEKSWCDQESRAIGRQKNLKLPSKNSILCSL